jgi:hypothetical protein
VSNWHSSAERARVIEAECDASAARLHLVQSTEEGRHGRWLLKGPWLWAEVVTLANGIYVGGDIETVVFHGGDRWPRPRPYVYWMATRSYGYAKEKAHIGDTAPDQWDEDCARHDILWHLQNEHITREQATQILEALRRDEGSGPFQAAIYDITEDGELCDMGTVTNRSVLAHLFDAEGFRASSHEWFSSRSAA